MLERLHLRALIPAAVAAGGLVVAVLRDEVAATAVLAAAFALGHLLPLRTAGGRMQPVSPAVVAAAVLQHLVAPVVWGAALGLLLGWAAARLRFGERRAADLLPGEAAGVAAFLGAFAGLHDLDPGLSGSWWHLAALVPCVAAWYLASAAARALWTGARHRVAGGLLWRTALGEWPAYLVLTAAGALYGLTADAMGAWAALLLTGPSYGFAHLAFRRLAASAAIYRQTIRALGRVPEAGGLSPAGHAERSADLVVAVGGELGLSPQETRRAEQAALLADIGRVVLGGTTPSSGGTLTAADLARWSAEIISAAPALQPVAALVAESPRPYRRPGEERDPEISAAAKVVKAATAYDYSVAGGMDPGDALEVLQGGMAYEYDPEVLAALRRVLERRGCKGV